MIEFSGRFTWSSKRSIKAETHSTGFDVDIVPFKSDERRRVTLFFPLLLLLNQEEKERCSPTSGGCVFLFHALHARHSSSSLTSSRHWEKERQMHRGLPQPISDDEAKPSSKAVDWMVGMQNFRYNSPNFHFNRALWHSPVESDNRIKCAKKNDWQNSKTLSCAEVSVNRAIDNKYRIVIHRLR